MFSSPTYRALETVRYAQFGKPQPVPELGDNGKSMSGGTEAQAAWLRKKVTELPKGTNTVIVTHMPNMSRAFPESTSGLGDGEALIFGPKRRGGAGQNRRLVETQMKLFACILLLTGMAAAQQPLTLASQGSFFVGGEYKTMPAGGRGRRRRNHRQPDVRAVSDPA